MVTYKVVLSVGVSGNGDVSDAMEVDDSSILSQLLASHFLNQLNSLGDDSSHFLHLCLFNAFSSFLFKKDHLLTAINAGEDGGQLEHSLIDGGTAKWFSHFGGWLGCVLLPEHHLTIQPSHYTPPGVWC